MIWIAVSLLWPACAFLTLLIERDVYRLDGLGPPRWNRLEWAVAIIMGPIAVAASILR